MGKPKVFNARRTRRAIEEFDRHYLEALTRPGRNSPRASDESLEVFWGRPLLNDAGNSDKYPEDFSLGAKGKVWALCLLTAHLTIQVTLQKVFVADIVKRVVPTDPAHGKSLTKALNGLIMLGLPDTLPKPAGSAKRRPPVTDEFGEEFVRIVADHLTAAFSEEKPFCVDVYALLKAIEANNTGALVRVSTLYAALSKALGEEPFDQDDGTAPAPAPARLNRETANWLSHVEDGTFLELKNTNSRKTETRYHSISEQGLTSHVKSIHYKLSAHDTRLVIVTGEPFSGKKTEVSKLLRLIATRADGKMCWETGSDRAPCLPVLALSAKNKFYNDIIDTILRFMEAYKDVLQSSGSHHRTLHWARAENEPRHFDSNLGLMALRKFAGQPALFVLTDVEAFHPDPTRIVVRDIGIRRLIHALVEIAPESRVLVTTGLTGKALKELEPVMPMFAVEAIHPPDATLLATLLRDGSLYQGIEQQLGDRIHQPVAGDVLLGIATLASLCNGLKHDDADQIIRLIDSDQSNLTTHHNAVFIRLLAELDDCGLLPLVMLVAFSEDGLTDTTLRKLAELWAEHTPFRRPIDDPVLQLENLQEITGSAFLISKEAIPHDLDEYGCFRPASETPERLWEFEAEISERLMRAAQSERWLPLAQLANRLIAIEARRQAQNKKMFMHTLYTADSSTESRRDIQSYISLLASLPGPASSYCRRPYPDLPLRMREADIFTADEKRFDAVVALRFAALCLLKQDIDRDFRLTMVTDEDPLRLELYLLLFQDLGLRHFVTEKALQLGEEIPSHIRVSFSPKEILELLEAIALSAYHAQRVDVVDQAVILAERAASDLPWLDVCDSLARIWCSKIDTEIARGGRGEEGNHRQTEAALSEYICLHQERAKWADDQIGAGSFDKEPNAVSALVRLLARKAELAAISQPDRTAAAAIYQTIEVLQRGLSRQSQNADEIKMNGRVARKYIRFLARDPEFRTRCISGTSTGPALSESAENASQKIQQLIDINIARLKRFSGGDRIGVLLDMARLSYTRASLSEALKYAEAAYERAMCGNLSLLGKTDVLAVIIDLSILLLEQVVDIHGQAENAPYEGEGDFDLSLNQHIVRLKEQISLLTWICGQRGFRPYKGGADVFTARLAKVEADLIPIRRSSPVSDRESLRKITSRHTLQAKKELAAICDTTFLPDIERLLRSWEK